MVWDYAETNPFSSSTGSWYVCFKRCRSFGFLVVAIGRDWHRAWDGSRDATRSDDGSRLVSTDPPYYDNVGYADLSDFFYVWLRPIVQFISSQTCSPLCWSQRPRNLSQRLIASTATEKRPSGIFEQGLARTFDRIRKFIAIRVSLYRLLCFQAAEPMCAREGTGNTGWETMLTSLVDSGFAIVGTWPMRTEKRTRHGCQWIPTPWPPPSSSSAARGPTTRR